MTHYFSGHNSVLYIRIIWDCILYFIKLHDCTLYPQKGPLTYSESPQTTAVS